ncbi:trehalose-phosphatase [Pandoraea terrae]|uniref:Trehalose 6-phosphate phosphatase n=1 Tax=Pandoraea terrae TaxID=1537710 RepID=A0A5E4SGY6_9BURK|nr:trehalose-phosphatase [Pandoraea terrae]VVD73279.1 trehalose-phosphatase [Pandoraea terrae]
MEVNTSATQGASTPFDIDIPVATTAFFFDLDGTLADLAPTPDEVRLQPDTACALAALAKHSGRAMAVISGRAIVDVDHILAPLVVAVAGLHGAEIRNAAGVVTHSASRMADTAQVADMAAVLQALIDQHPGLLMENKGSALALHYRGAPELANVVRDTMRALADQHAHAFALQPGKLVFELRPRGVSKGGAIVTLMGEAPFAGRTPLFVGDDLTDETGFARVNEAGGITIKIGDGQTCARHRLPSPGALTTWLLTLQ